MINEDYDSVDEVMSWAENLLASLAIFGQSRAAQLLDSDLSVDEFKTKWAQYTLERRYNLFLPDETAKNAVSILSELQAQKDSAPKEAERNFKPVQAVSKMQTYKNEATSELRALFEFIKREFDSGKSVFSILEAVARSKTNITA